MITVNYILSALGMVCALTFMLLELRRCLMMLQQNSYRNERYRGWLRQSGDSTSVVRLLSLAVVLASLSTLSSPLVSMVLIILISGIGLVKLLTARYKKPLVMTRRAWRIFSTETVLAVGVIVAVYFICGGFSLGIVEAQQVVAISALAVYCGSHIVCLAANAVLRPVERHINNKYINDARRILASMPSLRIIGITGSYGKTSTKHYLHRILSEQFDTLMTPGSFNTTMGVVRTVREYLKPYNEVFIVEMGAKNPGDIREICDLVHPSIGIVTAVGPQHLESFKTIGRVQQTKFELIDSLPADGLAIVNNDFEFIANRPVGNVACESYGVKNADARYRVADIEYTPRGTRFTLLTPAGDALEFATRLVGECNVSNLAAAIICALYLGEPVDKIRYAVERIEQVEHRLNMKRTASGVTIIDDAYNSNPVGSGMALDVLSRMKDGKRIVVTPGMIELGDRREELNREFGRKIAKSADIAVIVNDYNREAITQGALDGGMPETSIRQAASFAEAQRILSTLLAAGDTILYENDLPDTFK